MLPWRPGLLLKTLFARTSSGAITTSHGAPYPYLCTDIHIGRGSLHSVLFHEQSVHLTHAILTWIYFLESVAQASSIKKKPRGIKKFNIAEFKSQLDNNLNTVVSKLLQQCTKLKVSNIYFTCTPEQGQVAMNRSSLFRIIMSFWYELQWCAIVATRRDRYYILGSPIVITCIYGSSALNSDWNVVEYQNICMCLYRRVSLSVYDLFSQ